MSETREPSPRSSSDDASIEGRRSRRRYWTIPVGYICAIALLVLIAAFGLDWRSPKQVDFIGTCKGLTLPEDNTWVLPRFDTLHLRGFSVVLEATEEIRLFSAENSHEWPASELRLIPNPLRHTDQTSVVIAHTGQRGADSFATFPAGTVIQGTALNPRFGPVISVNVPVGRNAEIRVEAEQLYFPEVNRMAPEGVAMPDWVQKSESFAVTPIARPSRLISASFTTHKSDDPPQANFRFAPDVETASFFRSTDLSEPFEIRSAELRFDSCINPTIKVDQRDSPRQPENVAYDVTIEAMHFTFQSIDVVKAVDKQEWQLRMHGSGKASSLLVGNIELIPTHLDSILNGTPARKGICGLVFVFLSVLIGTIFKRACDAWAEYLIPDPPETP